MSYGKIYALGHALIKDLLLDEVIVQEKIDGSQFSFGVKEDGILWCRSKSADIDLTNGGMFSKAVEEVKLLFAAGLLRPFTTYWGEYLQKPKHNTLQYSRVPIGHVILFDLTTAAQEEMPTLESEAQRLGLEMVPELGRYAPGELTHEVLKDLLTRPSILGGALVEGVVIKNYHRFGEDAKPLMGKYVSEAFKETHRKDWKDRNPAQSSILEKIIDKYTSPARWDKALQHLRDESRLTMAPQDIPLLLSEVKRDVLEECGDAIAQELWTWGQGMILRGVTKGLPEWYKSRLAEEQFCQPITDTP